MNRRIALVLVALVVPVGLFAAVVTVPNTFVNGGLADADAVNQNFAALSTAVNGLGDGSVLFQAKRSSGAPATCDAANKGAIYFDTGTNAFFGCNGSAWARLPIAPPNSQTTPAQSCAALKQAYPNLTDGAYWIDPTPYTPGDAVEVWCDMTYDGGGWTTIANTLRPNLENVNVLTTPNADMKLKDPATRNAAIWRWPGEAWTEFMVECRTSAAATPARWVFVRHLQTAAVATGINDIVVNANNLSQSFGTNGNNVCPTKNAGSVYCGHNNAGNETGWGDGFQIGTTSPTWNGLLFGATDAQAHFKCSQSTPNGYTSATGDVGAAGIWTYRFR